MVENLDNRTTDQIDENSICNNEVIKLSFNVINLHVLFSSEKSQKSAWQPHGHPSWKLLVFQRDEILMMIENILLGLVFSGMKIRHQQVEGQESNEDPDRIFSN